MLLHVVCTDCAVSDGSNFIETSASSPGSDDVELEANITSHLTSARHTLDDINDRIIALKPSDGTDEEVTVR